MSEPTVDDDGSAERALSANQRRFLNWGTAILIDVVVLNLFVEYVDEIVIDSFTTSVGAAVLIRILIDVTLSAEHRIADHFSERSGAGARVGRVFGAWLVLFLSKFVILEAVDIVFGDDVELGGFVWVIVISLALVAIERATFAVFRQL